MLFWCGVMVKRSILIRPETLEHDFIPEQLPRREEEREKLKEFFLDFFNSKETFTSWIIIGDSGIGKTVLSRRVLKDLESSLGKSIVGAYVNCRLSRRVYMVLGELVKHVAPSVPRRGLSRFDLFNVFIEILSERGQNSLIILDELGSLFWGQEGEKAGELLYNLSRLSERSVEEFRIKVGVLAIVASHDEASFYNPQWLDRSIRASFMRNELRLRRYDKNDLFEILRYRASLAFLAGSVSEDALELISTYVAEQQGGNARIAIDILRDAGRLADKKGDGFLGAEHVRMVLSRHPTMPHLDPEHLLSLDRHKLVLLLAAIRALKRKGESFVTRVDVEKIYKELCEEYNEKPRKTTQLIKYIKELGYELRGVMQVEVSGKGQRGRSTRISINVPLEELESKVLDLLEG